MRGFNIEGRAQLGVGDLATVPLPLTALIAQDVFKDLLAEDVRHELGGFEAFDRAQKIRRERLDAHGFSFPFGQLPHGVFCPLWQRIFLLDALEARG